MSELDGLVGDLAHIVTGAIASNCCFRTGGRSRDAKACECRAIAEDLIENADEVIEILNHAKGVR